MSSKLRNMYNVPEGYFEGLKARLGAIPASHPSVPVRRHTVWTAIRPFAALAACLALLLTAGAIFLDRNTYNEGTNVNIYEQMMYSDMIPDTDPDLIISPLSEEEESDDLSDEDIIDYLISSGASAELIAYAGDR